MKIKSPLPPVGYGDNIDSSADDKAVSSRRRLLLSGIAKGPLLIAGAVPIKSLASQLTVTAYPNGRLCTISGAMSLPHSQSTITEVCGGNSPSYYAADLTTWPISDPNSAKFKDLFPSAGTQDLIKNIFKDDVNSDKSKWIAAYFNSISAKQGFTFPYSTAEVILQFNSTVENQTKALNFYTTWVFKL